MLKKLLVACLFFAPVLSAHEGGHAGPVLDEMSLATKIFVSSLTPEQREVAMFEFKDGERTNWHFVPLVRKGVRMGDLSAQQERLAFGLLNTGLSQKGFLTASQIMALEAYLAEKENDPVKWNSENYFLAFFGQPGAEGVWGWRFEGHHLSLNFTIADGHLQDTPAFFGTIPATVTEGPLKGLRPLGGIEDAARELAVVLQEGGKSVVFSEEPPKDVISGQKPEVESLEQGGVKSGDLEDGQRKKLMALIEMVHGLQREEIAAGELKTLNMKDYKEINFGWAGSLKKGEALYFYIQSPAMLIEYANTQNDANHAHLAVRNLGDDFGRGLLKAHYADGHE